MSRRPLVAAGATSLLLATASLAMAAPHTAATIRFDRSVRLTPPTFGGFEPSIVVDRFGNIYITAHKQRQINAVAPDSQTSTGVRTASFLWTSSDGTHFHDVTPKQSYTMNFGDEGEITLDGADHLYMVDTNVVDVTFARWHITGLGHQTMQLARPALGTGQLVDDRPWIAANSHGDVLYTGNGGAATAYPLGTDGSGDGTGAGRYTVYMSHNFGQTFDTQGVTLKDSGWCYTAADPRAGSRIFYVACIDLSNPDQHFEHALYLYASPDAGHTWSRRILGHYESATWPSVHVSQDGSVHVLIGDDRIENGHTVGTLRLFNLANMTAPVHEVRLPCVGADVPFAWVAVARNGDVAGVYYAQSSSTSPWYVYADVLHPDGTISTGRISDVPLASANGYPKGDFFEGTFGPDNKLYVAYTALNNDPEAQAGLGTDVYFARQQ